MFWEARSSRVLVLLSRQHELAIARSLGITFRRDAETNTRDARSTIVQGKQYAPQSKTRGVWEPRACSRLIRVIRGPNLSSFVIRLSRRRASSGFKILSVLRELRDLCGDGKPRTLTADRADLNGYEAKKIESRKQEGVEPRPPRS